MIASINPANGETLANYPELTESELAEKIGRSQAAWLKYRQTTLAQRTEWLAAAAAILLQDYLDWHRSAGPAESPNPHQPDVVDPDHQEPD